MATAIEKSLRKVIKTLDSLHTELSASSTVTNDRLVAATQAIGSAYATVEDQLLKKPDGWKQRAKTPEDRAIKDAYKPKEILGQQLEGGLGLVADALEGLAKTNAKLDDVTGPLGKAVAVLNALAYGDIQALESAASRAADAELRAENLQALLDAASPTVHNQLRINRPAVCEFLGNYQEGSDSFTVVNDAEAVRSRLFPVVDSDYGVTGVAVISAYTADKPVMNIIKFAGYAGICQAVYGDLDVATEVSPHFVYNAAMSVAVSLADSLVSQFGPLQAVVYGDDAEDTVDFEGELVHEDPVPGGEFDGGDSFASDDNDATTFDTTDHETDLGTGADVEFAAEDTDTADATEPSSEYIADGQEPTFEVVGSEFSADDLDFGTDPVVELEPVTSAAPTSTDIPGDDTLDILDIVPAADELDLSTEQEPDEAQDPQGDLVDVQAGASALADPLLEQDVDFNAGDDLAEQAFDTESQEG